MSEIHMLMIELGVSQCWSQWMKSVTINMKRSWCHLVMLMDDSEKWLGCNKLDAGMRHQKMDDELHQHERQFQNVCMQKKLLSRLIFCCWMQGRALSSLSAIVIVLSITSIGGISLCMVNLMTQVHIMCDTISCQPPVCHRDKVTHHTNYTLGGCLQTLQLSSPPGHHQSFSDRTHCQ